MSDPKLHRMLQLAGVRELNEFKEVTKTVIGHADDERQMLRRQLANIAEYATELEQMLEQLPENSDFPMWWQSKIILANKCIDKAKHYLEGEQRIPDTDPDEMNNIEPDAGDDMRPMYRK